MTTFQRRKGYIHSPTAQNRTGVLCVGIHEVGKGRQAVAQITRNGKRYQKRMTIDSIHNGRPVNPIEFVMAAMAAWVQEIKDRHDKEKMVTVKRATLNRSKI